MTSGEDSILGGTQVIAPITAPITVAGNAISGIGDSDRLIDHRRQHRQQRRWDHRRDLRRRQHPRRNPTSGADLASGHHRWQRHLGHR
ncbi:hypothetical protein QSU92_09470 [Microbacterium sp. ET2]|uniref:hypothetical protein n=1 Tax=Microbacterium albipurpureum TaxID=3050384 RepID=UPI00259C7B9E|nr:hypothetical protein [Microbacterium sp. ET2 (Ac-2212)]WJL94227.1 hypothetical protein QSU92_09470 [Microbacterium sp. ET2 (Ac-2212)]